MCEHYLLEWLKFGALQNGPPVAGEAILSNAICSTKQRYYRFYPDGTALCKEHWIRLELQRLSYPLFGTKSITLFSAYLLISPSYLSNTKPPLRFTEFCSCILLLL